MTDEFRHHTRVEVRFGDIDALRHVNNAVFISYVEQARVQYLREVLAIDAIRGLPMILAHISCDFRSPILFGEPVEVATRVDWIGRSSFGMSHRVVAGEPSRSAAEATSVLVCYDYAAGRPEPMRAAWRGSLAEYEGRELDRQADAR